MHRGRSARRAPARSAEGGIQDAILAILRLHPRIAWAVRMNAGAYKTPDGRYIKFGFVGCPDLWFQVRDGRIGVFEVKRPGDVRRATAFGLKMEKPLRSPYTL